MAQGHGRVKVQAGGQGAEDDHGSKLILIGNVTKETLTVTVDTCLDGRVLMSHGSEIGNKSVTLDAYGYLVLEQNP